MRILTLNGGSSSIRFAVYEAGEAGACRLNGKVDRVGLSGTSLAAKDSAGTSVTHRLPGGSVAERLLTWLEERPDFDKVGAVGHRVVHGMQHAEPERITPKLLAELRRIAPYDPDHLPGEIALIQAVSRRHPALPQVACFDTAFHRGMPEVAKRLPLPRRFEKKGLVRYGFHGLSYQYLLEELTRLDPAAAKGHVIFAHLGSGASMAAVHKGRSVDTSMGFTPSGGLMMGTRAGDIDPGIVYHLWRTERLSPAEFQQMIHKESGLLGVSGTSSDVRDLLARASADKRAAEAVSLFCYQACKWIGAFAAALGGLDTLVFSAGIGENSPEIRERICGNLGFLGVKLSKPRNARNAAVISSAGSRVPVRVIRTDEERMIARSVSRLLRLRRD